MNALEGLIKSTLNWGYQRQESKTCNLTELCKILVSFLQQVYTFSDKTDRSDNLVPVDTQTVDENEPVVEEFDIFSGKKRKCVGYKWPKGTKCFSNILDKHAVIEKGIILDRLGPSNGSFLSPLDENNEPYSISKRALPYLFLEKSVCEEPSYHVYVSTERITKKMILKKLQEPNKLKPLVKDHLLRRMHEGNIKGDLKNDILFGGVGEVVEFGTQGDGGGTQYRTCIPVRALIDLGLLKEDK